MKQFITFRFYLRVIPVILIAVFWISTGVAQKKSAAAKDDPLSKEKIEAALSSAYNQYKDLKEGKNADYIKELATVDPNIFGIVLITTDGKVYTIGDVSSMVSIQSVSKVFTMAKVIEELGHQV